MELIHDETDGAADAGADGQGREEDARRDRGAKGDGGEQRLGESGDEEEEHNRCRVG